MTNEGKKHFIVLEKGTIVGSGDNLDKLKDILAIHSNSGKSFTIYQLVLALKIETKVIINVIEDK